MAEPLPGEDQSPLSGFQADQEGTELLALILGAQQSPAAIASGDITNLTIAPVTGTERIYTARTTGAGTLTITAAAAGVYAACVLLLTSDGNGTNTLAIAGAPKWADGVAQPLAPVTGETLALYVQSIGGTIHLTLASYR